jgi:GNAT superfamily N-acetyltransferase
MISGSTRGLALFTVPAPRPLGPADLDAAAAIVHRAIGGSRYEPRALELLRDAALAPGAEHRGLLVEHAGAPAGVAIYGWVAGASGVGRLYLVAVAEPVRGCGIARTLITALARELARDGARFLLAEVPDDPEILGDYWALLAACAFREESRVADLVQDGVALAFLRRELRP